jgi:hypothetical protein
MFSRYMMHDIYSFVCFRVYNHTGCMIMIRWMVVAQKRSLHYILLLEELVYIVNISLIGIS